MQLKKIDFVSSNTFWSYEVAVFILEILIFCMDFRATKIYILLCQHFFLKEFSLDSWTCTNPFWFYKRKNEEKRKQNYLSPYELKQFVSMYFLPNLPTELGSFWDDSYGLQKPKHSSGTKVKKFEKSCIVSGFGISLYSFTWIALCLKGYSLKGVIKPDCSRFSFALGQKGTWGASSRDFCPSLSFLPVPITPAFTVCCSKEFIATRCHWH